MTTIGSDRVERVKASLSARFDELKRRIDDAKDRLVVRGYIIANPWRAVAIGALAGVVFGSVSGGSKKPGREPEEARGRIASAAIAGVSAIAMSLLKELASTQLRSLFVRWQESREPPPTPYAR